MRIMVQDLVASKGVTVNIKERSQLDAETVVGDR